MFEVFRKIWHTGTVTQQRPFAPPPAKYCTGIVINDNCNACGQCASVCPVGAITVTTGSGLNIDHGQCLRCRACIRQCPRSAIINAAWPQPAVKVRQQLIERYSMTKAEDTGHDA